MYLPDAKTEVINTDVDYDVSFKLTEADFNHLPFEITSKRPGIVKTEHF